MDKRYPLTNEGISNAVQDFGAYADKLGVARKDVVRQSLLLEEALIGYRDSGISDSFLMRANKGLFRKSVTVEVAGSSFNPLESEDFIFEEMLSDYTDTPTFSFKREKNALSFRLKKKGISLNLLTVAALILGALVGFIGKRYGLGIPGVNESVLVPVCDIMFGFIQMLVGPYVFLNIIVGILDSGNMSSFGRMNRNIAKRIFALMFSNIAVLFILALIFVPRGTAAGGSSSGELTAFITDMFPDNLFAPFISGNLVQIMLIAFLLGIAFLMLDMKNTVLCNVLIQIEKLFSQAMEIVTKLFPAIIFCSLVDIVVKAEGNIIGDNLTFAAFLLGLLLLAVVVTLVYYGIDCRESPLKLLRNFRVPLITAFATSSSSSTVYEDKKIAVNVLKGDSQFVNFAVSVAHVLVKTGGQAICFGVPVFLAMKYQGGASISLLISCALIATVMTFATPPVYGGCAIVLLNIIRGLSLPTDNIGIVSGLVLLAGFVNSFVCALSMEAVISAAVKAEKKKGESRDQIKA